MENEARLFWPGMSSFIFPDSHLISPLALYTSDSLSLSLSFIYIYALFHLSRSPTLLTILKYTLFGTWLSILSYLILQW